MTETCLTYTLACMRMWLYLTMSRRLLVGPEMRKRRLDPTFHTPISSNQTSLSNNFLPRHRVSFPFRSYPWIYYCFYRAKHSPSTESLLIWTMSKPTPLMVGD